MENAACVTMDDYTKIWYLVLLIFVGLSIVLFDLALCHYKDRPR